MADQRDAYVTLNPLLTDPTNLTLQRRAWAKAQRERNDQLRDAFLILLLTLPTPDTLEAATLQFQRACEEYARRQALLAAAFIEQAYRVGAGRAYKEARPVVRQPLPRKSPLAVQPDYAKYRRDIEEYHRRRKFSADMRRDFPAYPDPAPPNRVPALGPVPFQQPAHPPQQDGKALFLLLLLGMPSNAERLRLLWARARQGLAALGPYTSTRAAEILTRAMLESWSPAQLKASLMEQIGVTANRAALIAETELTRAHAEGQLDALEALGVEKVGAVIESVESAGPAKRAPAAVPADVEYVTAAGRGASEGRMKAQWVCPKCRGLAGWLFTIKEARGVIPQHPRCRCSWYIIRQVGGKR